MIFCVDKFQSLCRITILAVYLRFYRPNSETMKYLLLPAVLFCIAIAAFCSGNSPQAQKLMTRNSWNFIENRGQITEPVSGSSNEYVLHPEIKFYGHQGGINFYCKPGMISFVFVKMERVAKADIPENACFPSRNSHPWGDDQDIRYCRADLVFLNANPNAAIIASDRQEYYENFYLAHTSLEGITTVHTYKTLTYQEIYPHINLVLTSTGSVGLKYSFVVFPGGKVSDIRIQWNGLRNISFGDDGGINYDLYPGQIQEAKPVIMQGIDTIKGGFDLSGNRVGFHIPRYDKSKVLVIAPVLKWGTYFGGENWEISNGISINKNGDVFITGGTISVKGIATSGAFLTSFSGGKYGDAFLAKFSNDGKILWSTYFGGPGSDGSAGVAVDDAGNAYITGFTESNFGVATPGAYTVDFTGIPGDRNTFLSKFNGDGKRLWATYYGGKVGEANGITLDVSNHIYITGILGKAAYVAKFTSNGGHMWSKYFGKDGESEGKAVSTDLSGNVVVIGITSAGKGIASAGAYQTKYEGNDDAFVAKLDGNGNIRWSSYFGGKKIEEGNGIITDKSGNIYITGWTQSDSGIATPASDQVNISGHGDAYLAVFNDNGKILWSTYFGGPQTEEAIGICINLDSKIILIGSTESASGIATSGAYQTTFGGSGDVFLAGFNTSGKKEWATYYGGTGSEWGRAVITDVKGNIFITGNLNGGASGIATEGAYQDTLAGELDGFLAKFTPAF
jgi:hypothetical protein